MPGIFSPEFIALKNYNKPKLNEKAERGFKMRDELYKKKNMKAINAAAEKVMFANRSK
jgi:hypothetical protein